MIEARDAVNVPESEHASNIADTCSSLRYPPVGGYFMTQEDQDAVIGRVVRERRDLQTKAGALEAEAQNIGMMFAQLGQMLRDYPERVVFESHPAPAELLGKVPVFKQADINSQKVLKLVDDLRETRRALQNIEAKARQLGL